MLYLTENPTKYDKMCENVLGLVKKEVFFLVCFHPFHFIPSRKKILQHFCVLEDLGGKQFQQIDSNKHKEYAEHTNKLTIRFFPIFSV